MQPSSLGKSQVFLSPINLWATEVIPNSYFIWLPSHKYSRFWGETKAQEQPWQFLWRNSIRLLIRLTIQGRREAWLGELMGHITQKTKSSEAEWSRMLRWDARSASSLTQQGQWQPMRIAPAEGLQDDGGTTLRDQGQRSSETGLILSGWDRRAIHAFYIALFSPSHGSNIIMVISMIYCEIWSWRGCHKFNTLILWLLQEQGDCKEIAQLCFQCSSYGKSGNRVRHR